MGFADQVLRSKEEDLVDDDFSKELDAEMLVDIDRLREASRYGIPAPRRRQVWKYLLGVTTVDKREELSLARKREEEYQMYLSMHLGEPPLLQCATELYQQLYSEAASDPAHRARFRVAMSVFLRANHMQIEQVCTAVTQTCWATAAVHTLNVFLAVMDDPVDAQCGFAKYMRRFYNESFFSDTRARVAQLSMLFRYTQPVLSQSFEAEEIYSNEWALDWIANMLAGSLPPDNLLCLWDLYLAETGSGPRAVCAVPLHVYVCLALLQFHSERLMELERAEILEFLSKLPPSPMEKVTNLAFSLREDVLSRRLL
eukprot:TRINITY_DN16075_c0_g1_i2.p1 TRINITY_DN16075_c0_g1~~TRINITY_DN16075_c0_g1_i2.p1  ORF type:complete len:330 (+),score=122.58 TRINITY_DN16075_c0_g1_i2:52-990(+)